jgi:environmental stress-induced protein Ves
LTVRSIVTRADWRTQPWKNGGGVTHELYRDGDASTFRCRVSIAEVGVDGPFSAFPGVDRVLTVLTGAGFRLRSPERSFVAEPLRPVAFPGEEPLDCKLLEGPCVDLNVMRRRVDGAFEVALEAAIPTVLDARFVFAVDAGVELDGITLGEWELAVLDGAATIRGVGARYLAVRLS